MSAYICMPCKVGQGVCIECDVKLNRMVLRFFKVPGVGALIAEYRRKLKSSRRKR